MSLPATAGPLAFSPDGKILACAAGDGLVYIWDPITGELLGNALAGHLSEFTDLAFSPDGKWLVAGGSDDRLTLWDVQNCTLVQQLQFNTQLTARPEDIDTSHRINDVGFTPDSRTVYFSKGGGLTTFLEFDSLGSGYTASKQWKWTQLSASNDIQATLSRDGKVIALSNTYDIRFYDMASGQQIGLPMYGHTGTVSSLAFTPDGRQLVSGAGDGTLRLWDTTSGQSIGLPFQEDARWASSIAISPDGHWLASVGSNNITRVYDLSIQAWQRLACQVVRRNLYGPEWQQFMPDEPYRLTCQDLPAAGQGIQQAINLATARRKAGSEAEAENDRIRYPAMGSGYQ